MGAAQKQQEGEEEAVMHVCVSIVSLWCQSVPMRARMQKRKWQILAIPPLVAVEYLIVRVSEYISQDYHLKRWKKKVDTYEIQWGKEYIGCVWAHAHASPHDDDMHAELW